MLCPNAMQSIVVTFTHAYAAHDLPIVCKCPRTTNIFHSFIANESHKLHGNGSTDNNPERITDDPERAGELLERLGERVRNPDGSVTEVACLDGVPTVVVHNESPSNESEIPHTVSEPVALAPNTA